MTAAVGGAADGSAAEDTKCINKIAIFRPNFSIIQFEQITALILAIFIHISFGNNLLIILISGFDQMDECIK